MVPSAEPTLQVVKLQHSLHGEHVRAFQDLGWELEGPGAVIFIAAGLMMRWSPPGPPSSPLNPDSHHIASFTT